MDNYLRCDIAIGKDDTWYLIPTIRVDKSKLYLEIQFYIFCFYLYSAFCIKNYNDES
jgi:hypothetical protein